MKSFKSTIASFGIAALSSLLFAATASAGLIVDRGLPTANLNNAAGANRSNVAWADTVPSVGSMGDTFQLTNWSVIDDIRVWVVTSGPAPTTGDYTLWFGGDAANATIVNALMTATSVATLTTYANSASYQGSSGNFINIYQVDFAGLNLSVGPGSYAFGISGLTSASCTSCTTPFLHASNAALSGSPQDGANNIIYGFDLAGLFDTADGYPFNSNGNGWDKSSDINVQVFGSVPEPSSVALIAMALLSALGLTVIRRRQSH